jgi:putative membrane protein insertion efficiency factor
MNLPRQILIFFLRVYQWTLSPVLAAMFGPAGHCRFTPSCSQYAIEALQIHGVFRGGALAGRRLCRCHPWGGCGHDPVPEKGFKLSASANMNAPAGPDTFGAASRGRG